MKKLISTILFIITLTSYSQWSTNFQGIDSIWNSSGSNPTIWSLNEINNTLYLGGAFEYINNILVNYISKYDGQQCYNLNSGAYWGGSIVLSIIIIIYLQEVVLMKWEVFPTQKR
jgi:hypothetical protein